MRRKDEWVGVLDDRAESFSSVTVVSSNHNHQSLESVSPGNRSASALPASVSSGCSLGDTWPGHSGVVDAGYSWGPSATCMRAKRHSCLATSCGEGRKRLCSLNCLFLSAQGTQLTEHEVTVHGRQLPCPHASTGLSVCPGGTFWYSRAERGLPEAGTGHPGLLLCPSTAPVALPLGL